MASQTRAEIMAKLEAANPTLVPKGTGYQLLLLELILDVLVDIRDAMPAEPVSVNIKSN